MIMSETTFDTTFPYPGQDIPIGQNIRQWQGEFQDTPVRFGAMEAGVETSYRRATPQVMRVRSGEVTFDGQTYTAGDYFSFPAVVTFALKTGEDEPFIYFSRETDHDSTVVRDACTDTLSKLAAQNVGTPEWYKLPREEQYSKLQSLVGQTPLETITLTDGVTVLVKHELDNPSGSHYDRAYLLTLQKLEAEGFLHPGDELRDISSGSAGISLALLGTLLGYKVRITTPDELPDNRIYPMIAFGARVVSAGLGYVPAAAAQQVEELTRLKSDMSYVVSRPATRESRAFLFDNGIRRICYLNHSENDLSPHAFQAIGRELVEQTDVIPDAVLLAIGNWTTIAGITPVLREAWPQTQLIGYEGAEVTGPHDNFGTTVQGVRIRYEDPALLDDRVAVTNSDRDAMKEIVNDDRAEASKFGHSTLMGLALAKQLMQSGAMARVVTIAYDQKARY